MTQGLTNQIVEAKNDERPVLSLRFADGREWDTRSNCYAIRAYGESGLHCDLSFFAVYGYSDQIIARVPATHVEVRYV